MEPGTIVEFVDRREIVCGVVLELKGQKIRLLTEGNRDVSFGERRLAHIGKRRLDLEMGRSALIDNLRNIARTRRQLANQIDLEELWDVLHAESTWIDLQTMAEFCFDGEITGDRASAVMRAMFDDRLYFKFDTNRFFRTAPKRWRKSPHRLQKRPEKRASWRKGAAG